MRLQTTEQLELFHNRRLTAPPAAREFLIHPVAAFAGARRWLAERAYPIRKAAQWRRRLLLDVFHTPPQRNVALGSDGFVFLTGPSEESRYSIAQGSCIDAHIPQAGAGMQRALEQLAAYGRREGIAVDVVVMPTLLTLYPEHLPAAVPRKYREACARMAAGESALLHVAPVAGVTYTFPFLAMQAQRNDPGFFPQASWHASGRSAQVTRDAYLAGLGLAPPAAERIETSTAPSEILRMYGLTRERPIYVVHNDTVTPDAQADSAFRSAIADLIPNPYFITAAYANSAPLRDESVLMISDSYGQLPAPLFAAAFRSLLQLTANELPPDKLSELIARTKRLQRMDRLILLIHDGSYSRVRDWTQALESAADDPAQRH
jgi:hypothetical protein